MDGYLVIRGSLRSVRTDDRNDVSSTCMSNVKGKYLMLWIRRYRSVITESKQKVDCSRGRAKMEKLHSRVWFREALDKNCAQAMRYTQRTVIESVRPVAGKSPRHFPGLSGQ